MATGLHAEGFEAEAHVRIGDAAKMILDLARERAVDLIAMTTHGRTGLGRLVFGSVAEQVLRQSPVPVFLVRVAACARDESSRPAGAGRERRAQVRAPGAGA